MKFYESRCKSGLYRVQCPFSNRSGLYEKLSIQLHLPDLTRARDEPIS